MQYELTSFVQSWWNFKTTEFGPIAYLYCYCPGYHWVQAIILHLAPAHSEIH